MNANKKNASSSESLEEWGFNKALALEKLSRVEGPLFDTKLCPNKYRGTFYIKGLRQNGCPKSEALVKQFQKLHKKNHFSGYQNMDVSALFDGENKDPFPFGGGS